MYYIDGCFFSHAAHTRKWSMLPVGFFRYCESFTWTKRKKRCLRCPQVSGLTRMSRPSSFWFQASTGNVFAFEAPLSRVFYFVCWFLFCICCTVAPCCQGHSTQVLILTIVQDKVRIVCFLRCPNAIVSILTVYVTRKYLTTQIKGALNGFL